MKTLFAAIALIASSSTFANTLDITIQSATYDKFFAKFDKVLVNSTAKGKLVSCSVTVEKNGVEFSTPAKEATVKRFNQNPLTACLQPGKARDLAKKA
ncbi:hypothetical protein HR060_11920 [Catenovulum sp. SM1970]|uniref:hypothetical protein n=1 Tax=Marinifaba aquimaris TaxID=2741323 RepID=UPI0015734234|nr:hypothetical protein [Marinifaba aquimaris]NTS77569.1 hypothetical protein [Marinifaba aquimaris]NTS77570.1 hypothetical protein [Marinifaba aquimaris]NTS77571.1 hypothetical protein [Marinifaba aquimaris]